MKTYSKSTLRDLTRTLQNGIRAIQSNLVHDADDCALLVQPFRAIALEDEDPTEEFAFDEVMHFGIGAVGRTKRRLMLLEHLAQRSPRLLPAQEGTDSHPHGSGSYWENDLTQSLRNAIRAIQLGMICDFQDCALVAHAFRYVAIEHADDRDLAQAIFDNAVQYGLSTMPRPEDRRLLVEVLSGSGPCYVPPTPTASEQDWLKAIPEIYGRLLMRTFES